MKSALTWKTMMVGVAAAALISTGTAGAEERFHTLAGVSAEVLSHSEMAAVEGKGPAPLQAYAFLDPQRGFFALVRGDVDNPLFLYDPSSLNPDAPAVAFFGPEGLISFPAGNRNNPLFLYDPNALFNRATNSLFTNPLGLSLVPNLPLTVGGGPLGLPIPFFPPSAAGLPDLSLLGLPTLPVFQQ